MNSDFSYASRKKVLSRFKTEVFDFLVIGGGITGAAVARDAASRGLKVALIERDDFASGTSSASSKLIHGGLRYLENFEFKLVFESLSERAHLIRTQPNMVRWLKFYLPVYATDKRGMNLVSIGLWLYDLLSLFRAPHFHRRLSREKMIRQLPNLRQEGLIGGFTYYDASMWDDVMCVENARAASELGAAIATRVEAVTPIWDPEFSTIAGFHCRDREDGKVTSVHAHRTIVCGGPFTDQIGELLLKGAPENESRPYREADGHWKHWLKPSRGTHLVFSRDRLRVPGAMLLSTPEDGRISFVLPREDYGPGIVIVGTTDGPSPEDPSKVRAEPEDVQYLLRLLTRYFPGLHLSESDIVSRYVGVRPLMDPGSSGSLATVSREHHIARGPGGTTFIAGGKYTTHRTMALEIVDKALSYWTEDFWKDRAPRVPAWLNSKTDAPVNPAVTKEAVYEFMGTLDPSAHQDAPLLRSLIERYGADARTILEIHEKYPESIASPEGFPYLEAQLRHAIHKEYVLGLDDFYFRRLPLYLCRKDHAEPWLEPLSKIWAVELGKSEAERLSEVEKVREKIAKCDQGFRP